MDNVRDCMKKGRRADLRGMRHPMRKLTDGDVLEIRRRAARGVPQNIIAKSFKVTPMAISYCVRRQTWAHL
jgi:hypothetical protein